MRRLSTLLLAASVMGVPSALAQQSPLETLRFHLGVEEAQLEAPTKKLHESYRAGLQKLAETNPGARFPRRALALQDELAGFTYGRIVPPEDFSELRRLQEIYDREASRLELERAQALKALLQKHRVECRTLESRLQREGNAFQATAAGEAAAALGVRLEQLRKRLGSMSRGPLERITIRSRPVAEFSTASGLVATSEWAEGFAKDWELVGPSPGVVDNWSMHLVGRIRAPAHGIYKLTGSADDKIALTIAGQSLTRLTVEFPTEHDLGSIELPGGWHPFTLDFGEGVSGASFVIQWSGPGFEMRSIGALELAGAEPSSR